MISCCIITKNEERHLERCLSSVFNYVDEIIVVDSGSTDHTLAIAENFDASIIKIAWKDDYSYARNKAIEAARHPWILFLDADESLHGAEKIQRLLTIVAPQVGGIVIARHDHFINLETGKRATVPIGIIRLFRNSPNIRYEYEVHEIVGPSISRAGLELAHSNDFYLFHHINLHDKKFLSKKQTYYLEQIENNLLRHPKDPWMRYQKAKTLWFFDQIEAAFEAFEAVTNFEAHKELQTAALNNMGVLLGLQNKNEEAISILRRSLKLHPGQSQTHFILGDLFQRLNRPLKAIEHYSRVATKLHLEQHTFIPGGLFLFDYQKYYRLALTYYQLRLNLIANYYLGKSLKANSYYVDALLLKAKWLLKASKTKAAIELLNHIMKINPEWKDVHALKNAYDL